MLVTWSAAVWKMHVCAFCGVYGGMNDRNFEDHERILKEIKSLFFNTL
jgi:hypothetical protein